MDRKSLSKQASKQASKRNNCLNLIRLLAALDVFYGHAIVNYDFAGFGETKGVLSILVIFMNVFFVFFKGVPIFYILSGFLIWDSIERTKDFKEYARKRIFRIYPELWGAVIVSLISIVILYREKINWIMMLLFGITQATVLQFWTPDFLRDFGNGTPNGALWTICVIVQFYIVCWFVHRVMKEKSVIIWLTVIIGCVIVGWTSPLLESILPSIVFKLYGQTFIPYVWLFLSGCFMSEFYDVVIPFLKRFWWGVLLLAIVWIYAIPFDVKIGLYPLMGSLLCCASCLGFAYAFPNLNLRTDISYGIYLYHMVVINVFVQLGLTDSFIYFIGAFGIILVCAYVSTKTIGRVGMNLKSKNCIIHNN